MNVLVTGGCGYLGSVLVPMLLESNAFNVRILDKRWRSHSNVDFWEGDIKNLVLASAAMNDIDAVVHLAAMRQSQCSDDRELAWTTNYKAAGWLALLAEDRKFIFASTCSSYGKREGIMNEDCLPQPTSTYAKTKAAAEESVLKMSSSAVVLRFATMFGPSPYMRSDLILNQFVRDAVVGNTLQVFESEAKRPLVHVKDAARAIIHFLRNPLPNRRVLNIGCANATKAEMIEWIRKEIPVLKVELVNRGDPRSYEVSFDEAAKAGFHPIFPPAQNIGDLIAYYTEMINAATN